MLLLRLLRGRPLPILVLAAVAAAVAVRFFALSFVNLLHLINALGVGTQGMTPKNRRSYTQSISNR